MPTVCYFIFFSFYDSQIMYNKIKCFIHILISVLVKLLYVICTIVIINKTKVLLPQAYVTLADIDYPF